MTAIHEETGHVSADPQLPENDACIPADVIEGLPIVAIPLNSLKDGFFLRGYGTDTSHVKLLADAAIAGNLPPILVQEQSSRIIDGMHRIGAARLRGEKVIKARFINCSDEEAFILAVRSNTLHGLPLSRADRISGAKRILTWHPDWSDRAVGSATGLSPKTIAGLRNHFGDQIQQLSKRLGRDGKRRPVVPGEGRKLAAEYIAARPDASIREIARETGVSLGTVQDVRARLRRGEDPLFAAPTPAPADDRPVHLLPTSDDGPAPTAASCDVPRQGHGLPPTTWEDIAAKLASDPRLKYTEAGRVFFRWMALYAGHSTEWREYMDVIPSHWARDISVVAEGIANDWYQFAEQLRRRHGRTG